MKITLPTLPYGYDALAPNISAETLHFHHEKHHKAYVEKALELTEGTKFMRMDVEDILMEVGHRPEHQKLFNQVAQVWNHTFYWHCMTPEGGNTPPDDVLSLIERDFGSYERFRDEFKETGVSEFGSGYVWLVCENGQLKVRSTTDAMTPILDSQFVLLSSDVWEHTYYLDYQNRRPDYLQAFLDNLVNWKFVAQNLERMERSTSALEASRLAA